MLCYYPLMTCVLLCMGVCAQDSIAFHKKQDFTILNLTEEAINDEAGEVVNITGIFSASDDIYLNTIGFEFQGVFYSARGLGIDQVTFLLNGANQRRLYDDRPAWNNWSGVDIYRNQEITAPLGISPKALGRGLGITSFTTRASKYRKGTRVAFANSNRSYQHKASVSHASGILPGNWYYIISVSRRWGDKGFREGTFYDANALMLSAEKYFGKKHSLTASFLYTPNRRGLASILTNEVADLKGNSYNGNWGYQHGKKRNSRVRNIKEPLFLITHHYKILEGMDWESTLSYQFGQIGFSRIDYNGGRNPDPAYYQNLPSYWLSRNRVDFENVYRFEQDFINNGQLDWNVLHEANNELAATNESNAFVLYEDRRDENRLQFNSNITKKINEDWQWNASIDYRNTKSENFAEVLDLLGGSGYKDVASFTLVQSDLNNPDRIVKEGDRFKYNYTINSSSISAFTQVTKQAKNLELGFALGYSNTNHQREGWYDYENYADALGKSGKVNLSALQSKFNVLYKITGRNLLDFKTAYIQKAPNVRQVFPNARVSNTILENIETENLQSNALSYIHRGLNFKLKLTGYYNRLTNNTETGFYFAEGFGTDADDVGEDITEGELLDENSLFVQEVLSNITKQYYGLEFGGKYQFNSSWALTGVIGIGRYTYGNNPNLTLFTEDDTEAQNLGFLNGRKDLGNATIKNLNLSTGPQQAYSAILSYNDPNYWRLRLSVNHFKNNYVDIAPIRYTSNFTTEINGAPIADLDHSLVSKFRAQEQLKNFTLVNLSGGKSWRISKNNSYLSLYWSIQNVMDIDYRTGGFSSSRAANYSEQLAEYHREKPLFGSRYFVGNGRTYFAGIYYSF